MNTIQNMIKLPLELQILILKFRKQIVKKEQHQMIEYIKENTFFIHNYHNKISYYDTFYSSININTLVYVQKNNLLISKFLKSTNNEKKVIIQNFSNYIKHIIDNYDVFSFYLS